MSGDGYSPFQRTQIGGLSVSRMIVGTNWFLGYSHTSFAKDKHIRSYMAVQAVADILEVFLAEGIDTVIGPGPTPSLPWDRAGASVLYDGIREAEQRSGKNVTIISTPGLDVSDSPDALGKVEEMLDVQAKYGVSI